MIGKEKLNKCIKDIIILADILDNYAKKQECELIITSGYRSPEENLVAKGSKNSLHLQGKAIDFMFSDKYNIFRHVTPIYDNIVNNVGIFAKVTQMEVVRGLVNNRYWANHIHLGIDENAKEKIFFTGVYS